MSTPENLPQVRVSDAERDAVVARLNDATGEGRLTIEEFSERVSAALAAKTRGDLDVLLTDLPAHPATQPRPARAAGPRTAEITPIGSVKRGGNWRVDRDMELGTIVGSVKLDLRQAQIISGVELRVRAVVGSIKIWVPDGVEVDVAGQSILGSRSIAEGTAQAGAPRLRLHLDTVVGSVKVYRPHGWGRWAR
jgi:uncharacterized protein DUF1707/cell wall-active antibiotic response 4TMS protein YvqF